MPHNNNGFFFFNDTATTEIYTLSLHDALPICVHRLPTEGCTECELKSAHCCAPLLCCPPADRKSTRLNSSHANISYAVFCLKKKYNHPINIVLLSHSIRLWIHTNTLSTRISIA